MIQKAMSIYINELVYELKSKNLDICTLSLGEAFFELERPNFEKYDVDDLVHYTSSRGHPRLLQTLRKYYHSIHDAVVDTEEIMVTSGSKIAIFMSIMHSISTTKKKVAILEPAWLSYVEQVAMAGGEPINFGLNRTIDEILDDLDQSFCCLIINNPNNPSGLRYTERDLTKLFCLCQQLGINVIVDEAYSEFIPSSQNFVSSSRFIHKYDNVITVSSLSKNMGMSGFRIGYLLSNRKILESIIKYNQHLITCAPTILQVYIADNFFDILEKTKPQIVNIIDKREKVLEYCKEKNLIILDGDSTFYLMMKIQSNRSIFDFCMHLLLVDHLSVVPGSAYGESCEDYIRISIGTENLQRIRSAVDLISYRMKNGWNGDVDISEKLRFYNLPQYN
jgi:aspartate/methionine/tyrosine aminotransferase